MRPSIILTFIAVILMACTGDRLHPAPPEEAYRLAKIPGFSDIRYWGDEVPANAHENIAHVRAQVARRVATEGRSPNNGRLDVLVLSGGGSDGAFGAGLLNGWTTRGGRPEFGVVTGISTGALTAPYAFVGSDFDEELERFYTNTKTSDVVTFRVLDALMGKSLGLADTSLLKAMLDKAMTPALIARIAEEYRKGRRLLIGTTNLDAQRPVVWDIGKIAASGDPAAPGLIRDILLASSSIPGAFPPVEFTVTANGQTYTEMHVDGGVTRQLFFFPVDVDVPEIGRALASAMQFGSVYALRNTRLVATYAPIEPDLISITARSVSTLIRSAGVADIQVIETQARDNGFGLQVTAVPESFDVPETELFDPVYMRALYELGYRMAIDGKAWMMVVPAQKPSRGRI